MKATGEGRSAVDEAAIRAPRPVSWPGSGDAVVSLPGSADGLAAGGVDAVAAGLPVRLARSHGQHSGALASSAGAVTRMRVRVLDRATAEAAGVAGVVFSLARADGVDAAGLLDLQVDYSGFAHAFGGDYGARLRLVRLPDCVLSTPQLAGCTVQTPVAGSTNVATAGLVRAKGIAVAGDPAAAVGQRDRGGDALGAPSAGGIGSVGGGVYALTSGSSSSTGNWLATSLSPTYAWSAGNQGGDYQWSYPLRVPPPPAGPTPDLTIGYSSGSIDGRTGAQNTQTSWVGEGFDLQTGYIEKGYWSCSNDGHSTGDLCWRGLYHATMVFGGRSTRLVRDSGGVWHAEADESLKVDQLFETWRGNGDSQGELWRVTTLDGARYYFGAHKRYVGDTAITDAVQTVSVFGDDVGEPCHASTYANSSCIKGYRFNLDYVVDPRGNSMTYYYHTALRKYGRNNNQVATLYDPQAVLTLIEYGTRAGSEASQTPPIRVSFGWNARCLVEPCAGHPENWPDTPWDLTCSDQATTCPNTLSPVFFTLYRMGWVNTWVWNQATSAYRSVDHWDLVHEFPDPGDGTDPSLYLRSITHVGQAGTPTVSLPTVRFDAAKFANRVDYNIGLGVPPLYKWRVNKITNGVGGQTLISYDPAQCTSGTLPQGDRNDKTCFPQYFSNNGSFGWGWFHKYRVASVTEKDLTGGGPDETWAYTYWQSPAETTAPAGMINVMWAYDADEHAANQSWASWRGYSTVTTVHGIGSAAQVTRDIYYRGLDGDKTAAGYNTRRVNVVDSQNVAHVDALALQGRLLESKVLSGWAERYGTIHNYTVTQTGARLESWDNGDWYAFRVRDTLTRSRILSTSTGIWRWSRVESVFDSYGLPTTLRYLADETTSADDVCVSISYARNTSGGLYLVDYPSQQLVTDCAASPGPSNHLSGAQVLYDNTTTVGAAPTQGLPTKALALASFNGASPVWTQASRAGYDILGRVVDSYDALDRHTQTVYTPATGGPLTAVTVTNAAGHAATSTIDPAWGLPTQQVDPNGKTTIASYDALGRLSKAWLPGRTTVQTPNAEYTYTLRDNGANAFATNTLGPNGNQILSYQLSDGRMRPRQTQATAPDGKRTISDTVYDTQGLPVKDSIFYNSASGPTDTLAAFTDSAVARQHRYTYDDVGRLTVDALWSTNTLQWQTSIAYFGDRVQTTPPAGGTLVEDLFDVGGNLTQRRQYQGASFTGGYDATSYEYRRDGKLSQLTDPAGNHWIYGYYLRGWLSQADDPDAGTATYTYKDDGTLDTSTDGRGVTLAYGYDSLGRRTSTWVDAVDTGTKLAEWVFDSVAIGQLSSATRWIGASSYVDAVTGYDDGYRPTGVTTTLPAAEGSLAGNYTTTFTYRVDGSVESVAYPAVGGLPAETVTTGYTDSGLPTSSTGIDTYLASVDYSYDGLVSQATAGSGAARVMQTVSWDAATRRLAQAQTLSEHPGTPGTWDEQLTESYGYSPAGNLTSIRETSAAATVANQCFRYDYLSRLTNAWTTLAGTCQATPTQPDIGGADPYWQSFTFDVTGSRLTRTDHNAGGDTVATSHYPTPGGVRPHAVTSIDIAGPGGTSTANYDYLLGGQTWHRPGPTGQQTLTWDQEGHLATVTENGSTTSYVYDAGGARLIDHHPDGSTTAYLGGYEIDKAPSGTLTATRYYASGGTISASRTPAGMSWLAADHHNSSQVAIDAATMTATRRRLDPYGNPRGVAPAWPNPHGFVGGTVENTGLTHLGAREYDPAAGRFISVDPLMDAGDPQSWQGYGYAANNPITFADPSGLIREDPDGYTYITSIEGRYGACLSAESCGYQSSYSSDCSWFCLVSDVLGINDLFSCAEGSGSACLWTAASIVPVGKVAKAGRYFFKHFDEVEDVARHGDDVADAAGEAKRLDSPGSGHEPGPHRGDAADASMPDPANRPAQPTRPDPGGTANVHLYDSPGPGLPAHASISVTHGSTTFHTERVGSLVEGGPVVVQEFHGVVAPSNSFTIRLPNAQAAIQAQREAIAAPATALDSNLNNCVTHCMDILARGGRVDAPVTSEEGVQWLFETLFG